MNKTHEILMILLKEFDMEKGGDVKVASKLMSASIKIGEHIDKLNEENELNKVLLKDVRCYLVDTADCGVDRETLKARAEQYRKMYPERF